MRRSVVVVLAVLAILGLLAPPSFAQAPAPKVTISGLVDFVTTAYQNWAQGAGGNPSASGGPGCSTPTPCPSPDPTNGDRRGWYSRERGVFTITGEVGKVKGVWAIELDFTNGAGNFGANANTGFLNVMGVSAGGTTSNFNLDTDTKGAVETKWLYLETPVTGPGSLLPFIPVATIGRFGGQPFRGHDYKVGILASGDFPGVALETTWTPNVRSTVTFVQIGEALDRGIALHQKDDFAIIASLEADVFKGLTIKPTYAYAFYDGGNCGLSNLGTPGWGGYNPNTNCPATIATPGAALPSVTSTPGGIGRNIERNYFGADVRWTAGPFSLQPTFIYLLGNQQILQAGAVQVKNVPIRSFIADTTAGFRTGPLNIEARAMYTPGEDANMNNQNGGGGTIRRYDPINPGYSYMSGWTEIWTGGVDYASSFLAGRSGVVLRESPSYDKYGRIFVGAAADYSLTPALTFRVVGNVSWTDTKVDTKANYVAGAGIGNSGNPFLSGLHRYLGNEWVGGLTYRFAPNVTFDLALATLITGEALNIHNDVARNVYKGSARLRVTF